MADDKQPEALGPRQLVAIRRGFYRGAMVEAGVTFTFSGPKNPKWATEPEKAKPQKKEPMGFDTKPAAAQAAVRKKAAGLTGTDLA